MDDVNEIEIKFVSGLCGSKRCSECVLDRNECFFTRLAKGKLDAELIDTEKVKLSIGVK